MTLGESFGAVIGRSSDWHFWCGGAAAGVMVPLTGRGSITGDSLTLRWMTDSTYGPCPVCWEFTTVGGIRDSLLDGRYWDLLGGVGKWAAVRE